MSAERSDDNPLLDEAADWFLRARSAPDDGALRERIAGWRGQSPDHEAAWRSVARTWRILGEAPLAPPAPVPPRRPHYLRPVAAGITALAASLLLLFSLVPSLTWHLQADHVTVAGEVREIRLPDGSTLVLDAASAASVDYSDGQRRIRLFGGQAFVNVTPAAAPFSVTHQGLTATALGTSYAVRASGQGPVVAVKSGKVSVRIDGHNKEHRLVAGDRLHLSLADGGIQKDRTAPVDIAAWRERRLVVHGVPLTEVVAAIERHYDGVIWLRGEDRGDRRVSGVFSLANPVAALRAAALTQGASVTQVAPMLIIVDTR